MWDSLTVSEHVRQCHYSLRVYWNCKSLVS